MIDDNQLPVERGKMLSRDDEIRRWTINSLMCQFGVDKFLFRQRFNIDFDDYFYKEMSHIRQCCTNGLIEDDHFEIRVTELGRIFIRNVCMGFDFYLKDAGSANRFSRTV